MAAVAAVDLPTAMNFGVACASGVSGWLFVHPADVVKVRMQLSGGASAAVPHGHHSMLTTARGIYELEGFKGLYSGLSAAIMRQVTYTTLRLGFFDEIKAVLHRKTTMKESIYTRTIAGCTAGALASFLACPVEVCLVRMQADGRLPVAERHGYKNVGDALVRVAKEEGVLTYWRGAGPTVARAMVVSTTQLGTYDQAKSTLKQMGLMEEGTPLHLVSSLIAGFVYSAASLPLDTAKTRMQTQKGACRKSHKYISTVQTLMTIAREEGPLRLWKGFSPYFLRGGGHTVAMFLFYEEYRRLAFAFVNSRSA